MFGLFGGGQVQDLTPEDVATGMQAGKIATGAPGEIITTERLSEIYSAPVEVIRDSHGRVFVVGLEEETSHPHA